MRPFAKILEIKMTVYADRFFSGKIFQYLKLICFSLFGKYLFGFAYRHIFSFENGVLGGYFISQAYRLSEAGFIAPIEYIAMPMAVIWGITVFGTFPGVSAWLGITLIVGSGLYLVWRETRKGARPRLRR